MSGGITHIRPAARSPRPLGTLAAIGLLAGVQLRIMRNTHLREPWRIFWSIVVLLVLGALGAGGFGLAQAITAFLRDPAFAEIVRDAASRVPNGTLPLDPGTYLDGFPSLVVLAMLLLLLVGSFGTVLSSLFLATDLDALMVAPLPIRAVFIARFLGALRTPYLLTLVLLLPILVGYGMGMAFGPAYFVVLPLVLLATPLLPAGVATVLVLAVVRIIPARRARDIVAALSGLLGIGFWLLSQGASGIVRRIATPETLAALRGIEQPLLPSTWAGRALVAAGRGDWLTLVGFGGLFMGASALVAAGCVLLAERTYYAGWANLADRGGRPRTRRKPGGDASHRARGGWLARLLPRQILAIVVKDLRIFPRDLRNLQGLIFPLLLGGYWSYQIVQVGSHSGGLSRTVGPVAISLYVCLLISSVVSSVGIGREGRAIWILLSAPVSALQLIMAKWLLAFGICVAIGGPLAAGLTLLVGAGVFTALGNTLLVLLIACGLNSIAAGIGAAFPRLDLGDGRPASTLASTVIGMATYLGYTLLVALCVWGIPALGQWLPGGGGLFAVLSWVALLLSTLGVSAGAIALGARRLAHADLGAM